MLRLASLSTLGFALVLAACGNATIATGNGGGGNGGGSSSSSSSSTSTSTSSSSGGTDTCTPGGGTCTPVVPDACQFGTWSDSLSCGDGVGVGCCVPNPNDACTAAGGTCVAVVPDACMNGEWGDPAQYPCGQGVGTGCCLPALECGPSQCFNVGEVRCINGAVETCSATPGPCGATWLVTLVCDFGATCNSTGDGCVTPTSTCTTNAECGCGCGCISGACECTGGLPPSCTSDTECGPVCSGYQCISGACVAPACQPGHDQTCNESPTMSSFAGACLVDGTCACNAPFTKQASGKCG